MSRKQRVVAVLSSGVFLGLLFALVVVSRPSDPFDEDAYQRGLSVWGARSQPLPRPSSFESYRGILGDAWYLRLTGSSGRIVGSERAQSDASREQLAELLKVQPISSAYLAGMKNLDDGWVESIKDRTAVRSLALDGSRVTDCSTSAFLEMTNLEALSVFDTAISDGMVDRLIKLPALKSLSVGGPNIRRVQLTDHQILNQNGRTELRAGDNLSISGHLVAWDLPGPFELIFVLFFPANTPGRLAGDRYDWNTTTQWGNIWEETSGRWSFKLFEIDKIDAGQANVEFRVRYLTPDRRKHVIYRLEPFTIEVAPAQDRDVADQSGTR